MAGILSPPLTQADVNALMHLKKKDNFSFLKHHARCYIICKLEKEGTLNKKPLQMSEGHFRFSYDSNM